MVIRKRLAVGLLLLFGCASCSYQRGYETEKVVERSINEFHERLNNERYHEIYSHADTDLRSRISEVEFTAQLSSAHEQLGRTTGKAYVSVRDSFSRVLRKTFGLRREVIPHRDLVGSDIALGNEQFVWAVENDEAKLISYDFKFLCKKPCKGGFGYGPDK